MRRHRQSVHLARLEIELMKIFHCGHCQQLIFFENSRCVSCDHPLAYLPDLGVVGSLDPAGGDTLAVSDTWWGGRTDVPPLWEL